MPSKCCPCNGSNGRCKFCSCARKGRLCTSFAPRVYDHCLNISISSSCPAILTSSALEGPQAVACLRKGSYPLDKPVTRYRTVSTQRKEAEHSVEGTPTQGAEAACAVQSSPMNSLLCSSSEFCLSPNCSLSLCSSSSTPLLKENGESSVPLCKSESRGVDGEGALHVTRNSMYRGKRPTRAC